MITEISIDGFRCFNHTHIKGFEQVNLLGGKNNSGKTALLEAIMLACQPNEITLAFLRDTLRKESQLSHLTSIWVQVLKLEAVVR